MKVDVIVQLTESAAANTPSTPHSGHATEHSQQLWAAHRRGITALGEQRTTKEMAPLEP